MKRSFINGKIAMRSCLSTIGEYRLPMVVALFFFALTSIPYFHAFEAQRDDRVFLGGLIFPDDHDAYAAFCKQSERGAWLFVNPYRKDDHAAAYFNPLWLVMGKVQKLLGIGYPVSFQGLRLVACFWLICVAFAWIKRLSPGASPLGRAFGLLLFLCASGWGWLFQFGFFRPHGVPPDTHTEMFPFVQMAFVPHAALSQAILMTALLVTTSKTLQKRRVSLFAGGLLALLFTIRPYDALVGWIALATYRVFLEISARFAPHKQTGYEATPTLLTLLLPLPVLTYSYWLTHYSTGFSSWSEGNVYPLPALGSVAISLGFLWLFVPIGLFFVFRRKVSAHKEFGIVLAWALTAWFLLLVPVVPWSWRVCGVAISPLMLLALCGWLNNTARWKTLLVGLCIPVMLPTNLHICADLDALARQRNKYLFLKKNLLGDFKALDQLEPGLVFTHGNLGQKVPIFTLHRSFLGHKDIMPEYREGLMLYQQYAMEPSPIKRSRMLHENGIDYILYTYLDRKWTRYSPDDLPGWKKVYDGTDSAIYMSGRLVHRPK